MICQRTESQGGLGIVPRSHKPSPASHRLLGNSAPLGAAGEPGPAPQPRPTGARQASLAPARPRFPSNGKLCGRPDAERDRALTLHCGQPFPHIPLGSRPSGDVGSAHHRRRLQGPDRAPGVMVYRGEAVESRHGPVPLAVVEVFACGLGERADS
ncbi:hypothetical protein GCM10010328_20170 [Streptomyces rubiginosohelvolus]|uniref:Uncharacterized protein n=1 Tax=Streptomyces rubiginosohelvolus TaxID=67362 RepID=A0ABQ3BHK6_9ACTN|nr:hypothetical protein GCM10010328_20170 [Streptomyces pluricolorescens]